MVVLDAPAIAPVLVSGTTRFLRGALDFIQSFRGVYLPVEFEGRIEVAGMRVGSATTLLEVLDEMKDELAVYR